MDSIKILTLILKGQTPDVQVEFIASKMPPSGLGEPAVTAVAPAIANAIYQAVGVRLRKIPMRPSELKSALAKAQLM